MVMTISALVGLVLVAGPGESLSADDAFARITSPKDAHTVVMNATAMVFIQYSVTATEGSTGFFVWKKGKDGRQRVFLVTAAHVFENANRGARLDAVARNKTTGGKCEFQRWPLQVLNRKEKPLWLQHKEADIAALEIAHDRVPCVAISLGDLATAADARSLALGDELFAVGYPGGQASSSLPEGYYGFLRAGRVAGYPVLSATNPAFGIYFDASVSGGYSGAPLYWITGPRAVVVGVMTQNLQPQLVDGTHTDLAMGFASLAAYARELIENAK